MSQPSPKSVSQKSRSWIGVIIVIAGVLFLLLTLHEGRSRPYQSLIDALFHNWLVTAGICTVVWLARRELFGPLRFRLLRNLSAVVAAYFGLCSSVALVTSPLFWYVLKPLGIVQRTIQPVAVLGVIWLWGIAFIFLVARGLFRWFRQRYEHHGMAIGLGPVYFYFRRRRTS